MGAAYLVVYITSSSACPHLLPSRIHDLSIYMVPDCIIHKRGRFAGIIKCCQTPLKSDPIAHKGCTPGSPNSLWLKMSTTDHRQPSEFRRMSCSGEERYNINPAGASAEQIVSITIDSSLRKNLLISRFNYSYAKFLGELHYCNTEYHNSSMYVPNLNILPFNAYFISEIMWMPDMQIFLW